MKTFDFNNPEDWTFEAVCFLVDPSDDDECFGFFSRPTKAVELESSAA